MAVTVTIGFSGGTQAERDAVIATLLAQYPKPANPPMTDAQWAAEVVVQDVQRLIEDAAEFKAQQELTTARSRAPRVVRG